MEQIFLGKAIYADLIEVDPVLIHDVEYIKKHAEISARLSGATVVNTMGHMFEPFGYSLLILLSESSISIHSYPEVCVISIDFYTCGKLCEPKIGVEYLHKMLGSKRMEMKEMYRGVGYSFTKPIAE